MFEIVEVSEIFESSQIRNYKTVAKFLVQKKSKKLIEIERG